MESDPLAVTYSTPWGEAWVAFRGDDIVELGLPGVASGYDSCDRPSPAAAEMAAQLGNYWRGGPLPPVPPEMMQAAARTELVGAIYARVTAIPAGSTMTYAEVAAAVGRPKAARAVGAAMAANRYAPLIPCHRVVGSDGSLRGYAAGVALKQELLAMEAGGSDA